MSKILIIGDIHIDGRVGNKKVIDFFNSISVNLIEQAKEVDYVVLLGDYSMTPNLENSYRRVITQFIVDLNKPIIALLGQHDRNLLGHVLQPIMPACKNLKVVEYKYIADNCAFISHDRDSKALKNTITESKEKYIFGHFNINGYELSNKHMDSEINIEMKNHKFYLGDIHKRQTNGNITYVGSIAPVNLGQLDYSFAVLILDTNTGEEEWIDIDYGTKVVKVKSEVDLKQIDKMTRVIIELKDKSEMAKWTAIANTLDCLAVEFELQSSIVKKKKIDFNMNFADIVDEYLKMTKKEYLSKKIKEYLVRGGV